MDIPKFYSLEEVAGILGVGVEEVEALVGDDQLAAKQFGSHPRIASDVLLSFVQGAPAWRPTGRPRAEEPSVASVGVTPAHGRGQERIVRSTRESDPAAVEQMRRWALDRIRAVAPDLAPFRGRKSFVANGKQAILSVRRRADWGRYFFGLPQDLLLAHQPTFIVPILALDGSTEPTALVIPYDSHRDAFDNLSVDGNGQCKYHLKPQTGAFYLTDVQPWLDVTRYVNAFTLFR